MMVLLSFKETTAGRPLFSGFIAIVVVLLVKTSSKGPSLSRYVEMHSFTFGDNGSSPVAALFFVHEDDKEKEEDAFVSS